MTSLKSKTHQVGMKLTDAAVRGMDGNVVWAVIALSTLFTVYTSCVMLEGNKRNLGGRVVDKRYSSREIIDRKSVV